MSPVWKPPIELISLINNRLFFDFSHLLNNSYINYKHRAGSLNHSDATADASSDPILKASRDLLIKMDILLGALAVAKA